MSDDFGKAISAGYAALADGSWAKPQEWTVCKNGHRHSNEQGAWYCEMYFPATVYDDVMAHVRQTVWGRD